jgi:hypothetical protein
MIIGGWKAYYGLENNCKSAELWSWDKKKLLFETLVTPDILYGCEVWGCSISRESWRKIEQIQKNFIIYNLKIKGNTPYPILLVETNLSPIESTQGALRSSLHTSLCLHTKHINKLMKPLVVP